MITRKQVGEFLDENGYFSFEMRVYWEDCDIGYMNDILGDFVEDGHLLCDIDYEPMKVLDGDIIFLVKVGDLSEYFDEDNIN